LQSTIGVRSWRARTRHGSNPHGGATGERAAFFTKVCGALLVVRGNHAQLILPIAYDALDLPMLDLGVNIISVLAGQTTRAND
jgi:hypothetical protein